jgi:hypothetical protein
VSASWSKEPAWSKQKIGEIVELAGVLTFAAGVIVSVEHVAIGALLLTGTAAYAVGKKLRAA